MLSGASFVVVGALVGARMLLLARRTRGLPELLLGSGLSSLTFVTLPALVSSLVLRLGSVPVQQTVYIFGLLPVVGFAACLYAFTTLVFRPRSRAAWWLVGMAALVTAVGIAGTATTRIAAWEELERQVAPQWAVLVMTAFVVGLSWTGVEAARYHRALRRRLVLGLADPVVCNRFLLWAFGSLGAVAGTLVIALTASLGLPIVAHPIPIFGISFAGFSLSLSWLLALAPPERYLRWVRTRAAAPA